MIRNNHEGLPRGLLVSMQLNFQSNGAT